MVSPSKSGRPELSRKSAPLLSRLWYVNLSYLPPSTVFRSVYLPKEIQKKQKENNRKHKLTFFFGGGRHRPPHFPLHQQGTKDVRLDPQLNKKVWESGIKGVPFRLRVRISRKRNDEEGAKEKLYSFVQAVNVKEPKGLQTSVNDDA